MKITLIGMGSGFPNTLTAQGASALREATLITGAKRVLQNLPEDCTQNRKAMYKLEEILSLLEASESETVALLYSGDIGFYSGASMLSRALKERGLPFTAVPGISSVQLLSAAVCEPWQDWNLVSAHGCACDFVSACQTGKPTFFLTGGKTTPTEICKVLAASGFENLKATVGENLGTPQENIVCGTVSELSARTFAPLSVLLTEACAAPARRVPGLPDEAFIRGKTPMTKQEVRAAVLAKLAVRKEDILWDIGAGTGSVSVEFALAAPRGHVYAVECDEDACALIQQNNRKFGLHNLELIQSKAPEKLETLPMPNAVFIGGSKGNLPAIIDAVLKANPAARLCVSAIALETLQTAITAFAAHGLTAQVTQISVSRSSAVGGLHMMKANNPVFLIVRE